MNLRAFRTFIASVLGYILQLEDGKFYVGQSRNLDKRLRQHFSGSGAAWTKLHKPVKVFYTLSYGKEREAFEFMLKYAGIENVRGYGCTRTDISYTNHK